MFVWRGKPIFVKHRTPEDIKPENSVNVAELRHAQADGERVVDENWLVVIGICTHLGCVPIDNAGKLKDNSSWKLQLKKFIINLRLK